MEWIDKLKEFETSFYGREVVDPDFDHLQLRFKLHDEENQEVAENLAEWAAILDHPSLQDKVSKIKEKLTKEIADNIYVLIGTAVTLGLPLNEVFNRVHASNMSKLGEDGKPIYREDGKVLKGPNYQPPHLEDLFRV